MTHRTGRRTFLSSLAALTGAAALELSRPATAFAAAPSPDPQQGPWDLTWLDTLKGKHKQVFDIGDLDIALLVVTNNLDAYREVYGLSYPDINEVVGIASSGYPINASDAIWAKYEIGRRWKVKEPGTDAWATRNVFLNGTMMRGKNVGVKPLMERGAIFWQCNNALNGITQTIAADTKQEVATVKAELVAGLNPGVHLVPAHTMALGLVQERGCAYEKI